MDVSLALDALVPGAEYTGSLTDNTKAAYDALRWHDARKQPLWAKIKTTSAQIEHRTDILAHIAALEAQISPRRLREAITRQEGAEWLKRTEAQITALRGKL